MAKVIQIQVLKLPIPLPGGAVKEEGPVVYALTDDGRIWCSYPNSSWRPVPGPPS